ncbi:hypothetical protein U1Q18_010293 [Sarracenia purpurea var. burkii]
MCYRFCISALLSTTGSISSLSALLIFPLIRSPKLFFFPFYPQEKGRPLPKFGEWDVNDPTSAEGFTLIFNKARGEKKTGGNSESPTKEQAAFRHGAALGKPQSIWPHIGLDVELKIRCCEERPQLLGNVGMGARLCTYYQKSAPGDQTGTLLRNRSNSLGSVLVLDPADKSPFLGDIKAGFSQSCPETNMYRAPIFLHKVSSTDYLLVRSAKGKLSIRRIDRLDVVGQKEPHMEVRSPGTKGVQAYIMNRLLVYMYREFRAVEKRGLLPCISADELSAQFPNLSEAFLRKRLKQCADLQAQGMEVWVLLFVLVIFMFFRAGEAEAKTFLINCGTNASVNVDSRRWVGDLAPETNLTVSSGMVASNSTFNGDPIYAPLYRTARIFTDSLNYTFKGNHGNCFVRLHFYPPSFENYNANESSFSVNANGLKLVSEFNVHGEILLKSSYLLSSGSSLSSFVLIKEYFFNVDTDVFVIEFVPTKGSFGFVNAIEIIPVVDTLFVDSVNKVGGNGANSSLNLNKRGIETMYRLNVGGSEIKHSGDEFWRMWGLDSGYMLTADAGSEIKNSSSISYASGNKTSVAPLLVYETARALSNTEVLEKRFNMSWKFQVDPDFDYLIRLHFCELEFDKANQRIFRIYLNNRTAAENFDVFVRAGGKNKAFFQDYFDVVSPKISTLWIQLGPDTSAGASGTDALLNGLEVFKLSQNGNLAYIKRYGSTRGIKIPRNLVLWAGIGSGVASIAVLAALFLFIFCLFKRQRNKPGDAKNNSPRRRPLFLHGVVVNNIANAKESVGSQNPIGPVSSARVGRRFALAEIKAATDNFDDSLVIGVGGFGKVYKGEIEDDEGKSRPTMGEVLWHLEYVLQIHNAWLRANAGENSSCNQVMEALEKRESKEVQQGTSSVEKTCLALGMKDDGESTLGETTESDAVVVGVDEFSQLVNPQGSNFEAFSMEIAFHPNVNSVYKLLQELSNTEFPMAFKFNQIKFDT